MPARRWTSTKRRHLAVRLAEKIDKREPDQCWPWQASSLNPAGHGQINGGAELGRRPIPAHRAAFWVANGWLPTVVRHRCDNPPCCNPAHLEPGTTADNHRDMVERGRIPRGDTHWTRKNPADAPHGTISRYRQGCRCDACKADNARAAREYRASKKATA